MTTFHGTYGLGPKGIKKFYNRVMTYGQLVIAISNHIKKHITENYRINEDKIRLIHRCVDIEKFSPAAVSQERIIRAVQENNIPEDLPVISLIGRITRWKGQHVLLEALSKLKDRDFFLPHRRFRPGARQIYRRTERTGEKIRTGKQSQIHRPEL